VVLASFAKAVQALALIFERDSSAAFGDDIGGLMIMIPVFFFALIYSTTFP
jgi:hypothetical protein